MLVRSARSAGARVTFDCLEWVPQPGVRAGVMRRFQFQLILGLAVLLSALLQPGRAQGAARVFITTVAGGGAGDGGPAVAASLNHPHGIAADGGGHVFVVDTDDCRVREVASGTITTVAGTGTCGYSGDGGA